MVRKIAHITDLHLEESFPIKHGVRAKENWELILNNLADKKIQDVIFTGDIGSQGSNEWFFNSVNKYGINLKVTLGNHDVFSQTMKYYKIELPKERKELFYSHEDNYFKYIYLDTSLNKISQFQFSWFLKNLKTNKKLMLFIHHPILETNSTPQKEYPLEGSEKIKDELLQFNKDVYIFCGHLHIRDERTEGNITQFITPAACYQIKKYSNTTEKDNISFGYRVIEINNSELSSEVIMFNPD
jgi:Icc protein